MKKMIKIAFVAAFAAIAGYGVYANQKTDVMSDLALANIEAVSYTHLRAHETGRNLVCRLLLEKKKTKKKYK